MTVGVTFGETETIAGAHIMRVDTTTAGTREVKEARGMMAEGQVIAVEVGATIAVQAGMLIEIQPHIRSAAMRRVIMGQPKTPGTFATGTCILAGPPIGEADMTTIIKGSLKMMTSVPTSLAESGSTMTVNIVRLEVVREEDEERMTTITTACRRAGIIMGTERRTIMPTDIEAIIRATGLPTLMTADPIASTHRDSKSLPTTTELIWRVVEMLWKRWK